MTNLNREVNRLPLKVIEHEDFERTIMQTSPTFGTAYSMETSDERLFIFPPDNLGGWVSRKLRECVALSILLVAIRFRALRDGLVNVLEKLPQLLITAVGHLQDCRKLATRLTECIGASMLCR